MMPGSRWKSAGLCARFTLVQTWKNRTNLISFLILAVFAVAMPYFYDFGAEAGTDASACSFSRVWYAGDTAMPDFEQLKTEDSWYAGVEFVPGMPDELQPDEVQVVVTSFPSGSPMILTSRSDDSEVEASDVEWLCTDIEPYVREQVLLAQGVSEEAASLLREEVWVESYDTEEYAAGSIASEEAAMDIGYEQLASDAAAEEAAAQLQLYFSMVMMMVCMLSASYIIREVVSEKTSKLVDLLTVSMPAESLLLGKILGVLLYVISMLGGVVLVFVVSDLIRSGITGTSVLAGAAAGLGAIARNVNAGIWIVLVVTLLLGMAMFALLSGLIGAGCSTEEETGAALSLPMVLIMAAYMISIIIGTASGDAALPKVMCLIPVLSSFTVPVQYLMGNIGMGTAAASWLLQLVVIAMLIRLCGSVYRSLLVYRGNRLGFGKILKLAFGKGAL